MSQRRFIQTKYGTVEVRFVSENRGISHYGIRLCPTGPEEQLHMTPGGELITAYSDLEFFAASGLPLSAARKIVRKAIADAFDDQVREIVRLDILDHVNSDIAKRARELGLV